MAAANLVALLEICLWLAGGKGLMGPNREITVDTWVGEGQDIILFEEEPSDNILMDIQFR